MSAVEVAVAIEVYIDAWQNIPKMLSFQSSFRPSVFFEVSGETDVIRKKIFSTPLPEHACCDAVYVAYLIEQEY